MYSTYYGGAADDSDPVGERGIKFSNCRIYTIVTSRSNNIPLTQGAVTTSKSSSTSVYEPALIVWANPPDLGNNTITANQFVCSGGTPAQLNGSTPVYELPTIIRNTTTSAHPSVGSASAYQWQVSADQVTLDRYIWCYWYELNGCPNGSVNTNKVLPPYY
ncbi:MAG: hypothetical protein M0D57_08735 [Sphingobacteriales bacterium JAD_PAG50586_3]|nr:MAG: hypothetical protein M0D57_08735 [Sphingobacteriales bacterium JAD_PAG50586_3]